MELTGSDFTKIGRQVSELGLEVFGWFELQPNDYANPEPEIDCKPALLIGNAGSAMWREFSQSDFHRDGNPDPLNRWTQHHLEIIADQFGASAIFPFGETTWPFQRFAQRALGIQASPMGMLIHPRYGLWHAYRGALVFSQSSESGELLKVASNHINTHDTSHPCDDCDDKPCLHTCPVSAITAKGLSVESCYGHLASGNAPNCMISGCAARNACPVGAGYRYKDAHLRFHMKAFGGAALA